MDVVLVEIVAVTVDESDQLDVRMRFFTTNLPEGKVYVGEGHVALIESEAVDLISYLDSVFPDNAASS